MNCLKVLRQTNGDFLVVFNERAMLLTLKEAKDFFSPEDFKILTEGIKQ